MHDPQQYEGIIFYSFPFADDDVLTNVLDLEYEDQYDHEHDIEIESQEDLDPYLTPIPNHMPKWAQNIIEANGNIVGDPDDRRRTRSQYHNEHVALSHIVSLPSEWYNNF